MKRIAVFFGLLAVSLVPAAAQTQTSPTYREVVRVARKAWLVKVRSTSRVWTNDDPLFHSAVRITSSAKKEEAAPAEVAANPSDADKETAQLFAELDDARQQLQYTREDLATYQSDLAEARDRRRQASSDVDRDMLDEAIAYLRNTIKESENTIQQLEQRVAQLEQATQGKERPQTPAQPGAGQTGQQSQQPPPPR